MPGLDPRRPWQTELRRASAEVVGFGAKPLDDRDLDARSPPCGPRRLPQHPGNSRSGGAAAEYAARLGERPGAASVIKI